MNTIIITAGGTGKRMGTTLPKQFLPLNGLPVLMHTLRRFHAYDPFLQILLTLPEAHVETWEKLCAEHAFSITHTVIRGGAERYDSIRNALQYANGEIIGVHDGVRPLVDYRTIRSCFETAMEKGNAVPVVQLSDSIRELTASGSKAVPRNAYRLVGTPQCFERQLLLQAYSGNIDPGTTDDAGLVESTGITIHLVEGNKANIKITTPEDLQIAEVLLAAVENSFPQGNKRVEGE